MSTKKINEDICASFHQRKVLHCIVVIVVILEDKCGTVMRTSRSWRRVSVRVRVSGERVPLPVRGKDEGRGIFNSFIFHI